MTAPETPKPTSAGGDATGRPGGPAPVVRGGRSPWASAALMCSFLILCPPFAIVAPVLALMAMRDLRRHPHRTGRRHIRIALGISVVTFAIYGGVAWWWNVNVRQPLLDGPIVALQAGLRGDYDLVRAEFHGPAAELTDEQLGSFFEPLRRRYGRLTMITQDDRPARTGLSDADAGTLERGIVRAPYRLHFEGVTLDADAVFVQAAGGDLPMTLRWGSIAVFDPVEGDLYLPPGAADRYAPESTSADDEAGGGASPETP